MMLSADLKHIAGLLTQLNGRFRPPPTKWLPPSLTPADKALFSAHIDEALALIRTVFGEGNSYEVRFKQARQYGDQYFYSEDNVETAAKLIDALADCCRRPKIDPPVRVVPTEI